MFISGPEVASGYLAIQQRATSRQNGATHDPEPPSVIVDLADPKEADAWTPIDDRVMGGVATSRLRHDPAGHAVFEGTVSLERNNWASGEVRGLELRRFV